MITFLSSAKAFSGPAGANQMHAIRSWLAVAQGAEVFLYGDAPGTSEACKALRIHHVPEVETTAQGIPYFHAIATHARKAGAFDLQVYLNCDILLTPAFAAAMRAIPYAAFLMIGQRIDLAEGVSEAIAALETPSTLTELAANGRATLHCTAGIDYFGFRRGMWEGLPPVIIGRAGYDGALLAYCYRRQIPVVDATLAVPAFHQWHDYGHVSGGKPQVWAGEDAQRNFLASGGIHSAPLVSDADWEIRDGRLVESRARGDQLRALELDWRYHRGWAWGWPILRALWRLLTMLHLLTPREYTMSMVIGRQGESEEAPRV